MISSKAVRPLAGLAVVVVLLGGLASTIGAQGSISITFSSFGNAAWPAGPDFATDVLGDPWDFCNQDDVAPDPGEVVGWSNFSVNTSSCLAGGTTATVGGRVDTQMSLLYRGRYGILNPGRTGRRYPIDSSKYQKLAYRMSDTVGGSDGGRINWFQYAWEDPSNTTGDPNGGGMAWAPTNVVGWHTYIVDLTQPPAGGLAWTNGVVRGFRLSPNTTQAPSDVVYGWVRLTTADNASGSAMQTISWSSGSGTKVEVWNATNTTQILTITSSSSGSSANWNYGVLPPGTYTMRVSKSGAIGTKPFTIATPPVVNVTEPNETGDEDFATTVLGNAWDMDSAADVQISGSDNYTPVPASFSGGIMTATNTSGDPNITLLNERNNGTPIDTSRYRFFTVRMSIDDPNNTREWGIGRVFWTSQRFLDGNTATSTKDIEIWPSMYTYTVDLASLSTAADGGLEPGSVGQAWTSANMLNLRFDPSEFPDPRPFHIEYIRLRAMAETINNTYTIKWTSTGDPNASVTLYIDSDTNSSNGKTQIASGLTMGAGQYAWNSSGIPEGSYWVYVEANDGIQTTGRYSTGQVRVRGASAPVSNPAMALDAPAPGSAVGPAFSGSGWAIDRGATSGTGVTEVHLWAFPAGGGPAQFLGVANYGSSRPDIGTIFGSQFTNSGFSFSVSNLAAGTYNITAYAKSSVTGTFSDSRTVTVTVGATVSSPAIAVDAPANGSHPSLPMTVSGWAIDRGASTSTGISAVHVWAFPVGGGSAFWLGLASYGISRPDVGAVFGSQFTNSGYSLSAGSSTGLVSGRQYDIVVYAYSTLTNSFSPSGAVRVTIQ